MVQDKDTRLRSLSEASCPLLGSSSFSQIATIAVVIASAGGPGPSVWKQAVCGKFLLLFPLHGGAIRVPETMFLVWESLAHPMTGTLMAREARIIMAISARNNLVGRIVQPRDSAPNVMLLLIFELLLRAVLSIIILRRKSKEM